MTRAEKFNELREGFKKELRETFPELVEYSIGINELIKSKRLTTCESVKCPDDGDCEKCPLKNYWTEEYREVKNEKE